MNDTDIHDADVERFLAAVRAALDDLPRGVVDELVDGLAADLAETRAERGEPLDQAVGSPEAYAAELRAAAGLPPRTEPATVAPRPPLARRLADAFAPLGEVPALRPVWQLLAELRPAWWLLRAYIAVWLVLSFTVPEPLRHFPILTAGRGYGGVLGAGVLLIAATACSVWLGRRSWSGAPRAIVIAANVFAIYAGYALLVDGMQPRLVFPADEAVPPDMQSGLDEMTNIEPFTIDG